ncbi:MAG TPA: flagellar hook assembly protein FlgD [Steroidobacteraceae bacterium]|nr:flagellar hook assembly protein FlgD [Steroidobacteraceae bacterium]
MTTTAIGSSYLSGLAIQQPSGNSASAAAGNSQLSQQDFLNLMITQFKNQDPLNPASPSDMLAQLAQFGTVSGLSQLQTSIQSLTSSLMPSQALQATSLIGHSVLVPSSQLALGATGGADVGLTVPAAASQVTAGIYDSTGRLVDTVSLGPQAAGTTRFTWDGTDGKGTRQPAGTYTIQAVAAIGGQSTALQTLAGATVSSVALGGSSGTTLYLNGLGPIPLANVQAIYN